MPARDMYHAAVRHALIADGWTITNDPLVLKFGERDMYVDLGAEQLMAAQKSTRKIAVEVKSFLSPSVLSDLERALGQYIVYADVLAIRDPDRELYLAMPYAVVDLILNEPLGKLLVHNRRLQVIVFDPQHEVITRWIPQ